MLSKIYAFWNDHLGTSHAYDQIVGQTQTNQIAKAENMQLFTAQHVKHWEEQVWDVNNFSSKSISNFDHLALHSWHQTQNES